MKYFLCKLIPPRPTFSMEMTDQEKAVMQKHADYWREQASKRFAIVVGPVLDPKGVWGVAVLAVEDEAHLQQVTQNDPAMLSKLGFQYETYPMPSVILPS
jgi:uncharacterized protein